MRNQVALLAAAAAFAGFATPAAAATPPGPYLGVGAGIYTLDVDTDDLEDFDDDAGLFRAFGGMRVGPNWAFEADYQRLAEANGSFGDGEAELDVDAWTVSLRPIIPLGELIDLYGRIGWTWYDTEGVVEVDGEQFSFDDSDNDFSWGGGVDLHLGDNFSLRGDFSRIEIDDTDLNLISASVLLRF